MKQMDVDTLRGWLEKGQPVTVLDIRNSDDRAQWSIPGSMHVNAYAALKAGDPNALQQVELPVGRPVVTICNAGVVSQVAAEQLRRRGLDAAGLVGGMKSWSLAWNTADLPLTLDTGRPHPRGHRSGQSRRQRPRDRRVAGPDGLRASCRSAWLGDPLRPGHACACRSSLSVTGSRRINRGYALAAPAESNSICLHPRSGW